MSAPPPTTSSLARPLAGLRGVGPERKTQLARLGLLTIEDLLLHRPLRYEDRRHTRSIADLELGQPATTRGTIVALGLKRYGGGRKSVFEIILDDGAARLHCRWWNLPFMEQYFATGDEVFVFGKPLSLKPRTIDHPETEVIEGGEESFIHINRIAPVYPLTEGLPQRWLRSLIWRVLEEFAGTIAEPWPQLAAKFSTPAPGSSAADLSCGAQRAPGSSPSPPRSGGEGRGEVAPSIESVRAVPVGRAVFLSSKSTALPSGYRPFLPRADAVRLLHFPETFDDTHLARRRLALDEFITLQRDIQLRRCNFEAKARGLPCGGDNHWMKPFLARLGFQLTAAQTRVLRELRHDLSGPHPMRRLLQGDVGSGKTVVAACCALMTLESGCHVALMAPTEILAGQHFQTFRRWFEPLGISVHLQTGSRKTGTTNVKGDPASKSKLAASPFAAVAVGGKARQRGSSPSPPRSGGEGRGEVVPSINSVPAALLSGGMAQTARSSPSPPRSGGEGRGEVAPFLASPPATGSRRGASISSHPIAAAPTITIGTHALLEAGFAPERLGLVIIDEQHKFGVAQREQLVRKGAYPHLLVMTATPIPRTLGLTLYGELDLSIIDELPPGRGRIQTFVRTADRLPKVWEFIRAKLAQGRQAYVVYPRVEDTAGGLKAVTGEFANLQKVFAPWRVSLLHGRLTSAEKDAAMTAFRSNKVQILLATPLIEVGLDVPNATVMLIEDAAQFGLAQLHQLRGRIGRGAHESFCILVAAAKSPEAQERLKIVADTTDGFRIAEADLKLRGPGELLGRQQSGLPPFRFGDLTNDLDLINLARQLAPETLPA